MIHQFENITIRYMRALFQNIKKHPNTIYTKNRILKLISQGLTY